MMRSKSFETQEVKEIGRKEARKLRGFSHLLDENDRRCIVMQEASDAHSKTADSDTVSTYQVSSVQLVTDKKLEAFNKA